MELRNASLSWLNPFNCPIIALLDRKNIDVPRPTINVAPGESSISLICLSGLNNSENADMPNCSYGNLALPCKFFII